MEENLFLLKEKKRFNYFKIILIILIIFFLFFCTYFIFFQKPKDFKINEIFVIEEGTSLRVLSGDLKEQDFINSRVLFESSVIILGGEKKIIPGDYLFNKKISVINMANRIVKGKKGISSIKVTIPEGFDNEEIASLFKLKLRNFNKDNFLNKTNEQEGFLFPDTYFFLSSDDEEQVIKLMQENFERKTEDIFVGLNEKEVREIIIMASLIEKEAKGDEDRALISGILWRRFKIGMPLQVDAEPITYKRKGLPDYPICNPGILAIKSAMNPEPSSYLYYLHDKNGDIHFAKSFTEHKQNIDKYLR